MTPNPLDGKVALITGASSGIGQACARALAAKDMFLVLVGRRLDRMEELAEQIVNTYDVGIHTVELDISKKDEVVEKLEKLPRIWKRVDLLVNNAGVGLGLGKIQDGDLDQWEQMIDTNIKGLLTVTRSVLPGMIERDFGHIINIGSNSGHDMYPTGNVYSATKHAVTALSRALRMDLLGKNIRVTNISPGLVRTEFAKVINGGDEESAQRFYDKLIPLEAEDIAETVVWSALRPPHVNIDEIVIQSIDQASVHHVNWRK